LCGARPCSTSLRKSVPRERSSPRIPASVPCPARGRRADRRLSPSDPGCISGVRDRGLQASLRGGYWNVRFISAFVFCASLAAAQQSEPPPETVTIDQAAKEAVEKNLGLLAERYNVSI